jgi:hypothetical protein
MHETPDPVPSFKMPKINPQYAIIAGVAFSNYSSIFLFPVSKSAISVN